MGSSDSKEEEPVVINKNQKKSPRAVNFDGSGNKPSPRQHSNNGSIYKSNNSIRNNPSGLRNNPSGLMNSNRSIVKSRFKDQPEEEVLSGQEGDLNAEEEANQIAYFEQWPEMFHQEGEISLKLDLLQVRSTLNHRKLQRMQSSHEGVLSWNYEINRDGPEPILCLRVLLEEEGGFAISFLVDESSKVLQGDQSIWDLLAPFRTQEEVTKVGSFFCERTYQGEQPKDEDELEKESDPQLFLKWGQKPVEVRKGTLQVLSQRRVEQKIRENQGNEYRQTNKYFNSKNEWRHSVLVEEKNNSFTSWLLSLKGEKKDQMGETLSNDLQNRQSIYIEEMNRQFQLLKALKNRKGQ